MPYFYTEDRAVTLKFLEDLNERTPFEALDENYVEFLKSVMNYSPLIKIRKLNLDSKIKEPDIVNVEGPIQSDYFPSLINTYEYSPNSVLPLNFQKSLEGEYDYMFISYEEQSYMNIKPEIRVFIQGESSNYLGEVLVSNNNIPTPSQYSDSIRVITNNEGQTGLFINFIELKKRRKVNKIVIAIQDTNTERHYTLKASIGSFIHYSKQKVETMQSLKEIQHERYNEPVELTFTQVGESTWTVRVLSFLPFKREITVFPEAQLYTELNGLYPLLYMEA